jgi:hypothetical protein
MESRKWKSFLEELKTKAIADGYEKTFEQPEWLFRVIFDKEFQEVGLDLQTWFFSKRHIHSWDEFTQWKAAIKGFMDDFIDKKLLSDVKIYFPPIMNTDVYIGETDSTNHIIVPLGLKLTTEFAAQNMFIGKLYAMNLLPIQQYDLDSSTKSFLNRSYHELLDIGDYLLLKHFERPLPLPVHLDMLDQLSPEQNIENGLFIFTVSLGMSSYLIFHEIGHALYKNRKGSYVGKWYELLKKEKMNSSKEEELAADCIAVEILGEPFRSGFIINAVNCLTFLQLEDATLDLPESHPIAINRIHNLVSYFKNHIKSEDKEYINRLAGLYNGAVNRYKDNYASYLLSKFEDQDTEDVMLDYIENLAVLFQIDPNIIYRKVFGDAGVTFGTPPVLSKFEQQAFIFNKMYFDYVNSKLKSNPYEFLRMYNEDNLDEVTNDFVKCFFGLKKMNQDFAKLSKLWKDKIL